MKDLFAFATANFSTLIANFKESELDMINELEDFEDVNYATAALFEDIAKVETAEQLVMKINDHSFGFSDIELLEIDNQIQLMNEMIAYNNLNLND